HDNVGPVLLTALVILRHRVLDASLDIEAIALLHVLLDQVGESVPEREAMPLGLLLLLPAPVVERTVRGERDLGDLDATARRLDLGLVTDVPDEHHLVEGATHAI